MSHFKEAVNQSYEPVLSFVPKNKHGLDSRQIPVGVMDSETHRLVQIDDLYNAVNSTRTATGALVLRRSLSMPMTDAALITEKQRSLAELRADSQLRAEVANLVVHAASDEKLLYSHYRGDYAITRHGSPNIYDATKGSARLLGRLAQDSKRVKTQTDYLNALMANLTDLSKDDVYRFIRGPVYRTPWGLRPGDDVGLLTPGLRFLRTDWKPIRLLANVAPLAGILAGFNSGDPYTMTLTAMGGMLYIGWPDLVTDFGREFDKKLYGKPLGEMYFGNAKVVNAIESLGRMDELLSLVDYADSLQVPVTLPKVEDSPQHRFEARGLRNPVLVKNNPAYVGNDVELNGARVTFLTGSNSGGKTSLSKTILQAQILAQIGSYIPAQEARVGVARGIYYHSPMVNSLQDEEGRFGVEIARTRDIFFKATPQAIVVLDELIEATTYEEKIRHSVDILEGFFAKGGNTILVTHNHELAAHFRERGLGQFWQVEFDGSAPTHRIVPGISRESRSDNVLERLGFTKDDIERHLRGSGYKPINR